MHVLLSCLLPHIVDATFGSSSVEYQVNCSQRNGSSDVVTERALVGVEPALPNWASGIHAVYVDRARYLAAKFSVYSQPSCAQD